MSWRPTNPESLELLRRLRNELVERGDDRLALLLAGVELYATLGREYELLDIMRVFAHEMHEAVQGTPTAIQLEELFKREPPV
jgi:hypothetical protein